MATRAPPDRRLTGEREAEFVGEVRRTNSNDATERGARRRADESAPPTRPGRADRGARRRADALAAAIAPACRELERALLEAPPDLTRWRERLGPHDDAALARGLAQAATHAALVARRHPPAGWLAEAFNAVRTARPAAFAALERAVPADVSRDLAVDDPGLHLFEHLLAACDADTRDAVGAYYTPRALVDAQISLVEQTLASIGADWIDPRVRIIDPACGTGIYPHALASRVRERLGAAALPQLSRNLLACELLPGPAIVSHGHLAAAGLPAPQVVCRDTLHAPVAVADDTILVCIGNPPYSRHAPRGNTEHLLAGFLPPAGAGIHAKNLYNDYVYFWRWAAEAALTRSGPGIVCFVTAASWLRGPGFNHMRARLRDLADELWILDLGGDSLGSHRSANIFNNVRIPVCVGLAVRRGPRAAPTSVDYARLEDSLGRDAKLRVLSGVRTFADLPWSRVIDPDALVAAPVADDAPRLVDIFPWQHSGAQFKRTWPVGETRELLGRRWHALLAAADRAGAFRETRDRTIARAAPPLVVQDVAPSSVGPSSSASIAPSTCPVHAVASPLSSADLSSLSSHAGVPLAALPSNAPPPPIVRYAFRSFDRRWCLADARLGDFLRPPLWGTRGERQIFLTTLLSDTPSRGPAVVATAEVPDLHHYSGRGGADVLPLYRDAAGRAPNVTPGLLEALGEALGRSVDADDLAAYVMACTAHPAYTATLREPSPRVPISRDPALFAAAVALGREVVRGHTFGARMNPEGRSISGRARCTGPISPDRYPADFEHSGDVLRVGDGRFAPVERDTFDYSVSGLAVVPSWLGYRMQRPRGRTSSPLDALRPERWTADMSDELLELLWTIELLVALHTRQADLLAQVLAGPRFAAADLSRPAAASRRPP